MSSATAFTCSALHDHPRIRSAAGSELVPITLDIAAHQTHGGVIFPGSPQAEQQHTASVTCLPSFGMSFAEYSCKVGRNVLLSSVLFSKPFAFCFLHLEQTGNTLWKGKVS